MLVHPLRQPLASGAATGGRQYTGAPVYILWGQSNMLGQTTYTGDLLTRANTKIWDYANSEWDTLVLDPAGTLSTNLANTTTDIGPEMGFAEAAEAYHTGQTVYIIKYAVGGTSMDSDWLAHPHGSLRGTNFSNLLTYIAAALAAIPEAYHVRAQCVMIGETDSTVQQDANYYAYNLANAMNEVSDLCGDRHMRKVIGKTEANGAAGLTYVSTVQDGQDYLGRWFNGEIIGEGNTNADVVETSSIPRATSNVHFTEAGFSIFGAALFNKAKKPTKITSDIQWYQVPYVGPMYSSSSESYFTKDGSENVSQWEDISPFRIHMAQGTEANQPVYDPTGYNGVPALNFTAANNEFMQAGNNGNRTFALADCKYTNFIIATDSSTTNAIVYGKYGGSANATFYNMLDEDLATHVTFFVNNKSQRRGVQEDGAGPGAGLQNLIFEYDGSIDTVDDGTADNDTVVSGEVSDRFENYRDATALTLVDFINSGLLSDNYSSTSYLALGAAVDASGVHQGSAYGGDIQFVATVGKVLTLQERNALLNQAKTLHGQ